jgi:galactokinase
LRRPASLAARDRAIAGYRGRFGADPHWVSAAPGRVNLIGEHTDYNDGFVLPMAIEAQTVVAASPVKEQTVTVQSGTVGETVLLDLTTPSAPGKRHWWSYVAGVIEGARRRGTGLRGFRAVIESDVPLGGGLSSSAALEVSVAGLVETMAGERWSAREKAALCQRAEHEFAGVPSGIMDQLVSILATANHALAIDCRSLETEHVPLSDAGMVILIVNTNVRHALADSAYATRRAECAEAARRLRVPSLRDATMDDVVSRAADLGTDLLARARHVVSENTRVGAAVEAAREGQWADMGALMYESHRSLRDDFAVSCLELDVLVEAASDIGVNRGVFGCRMTGGGFGGSVVCLAKRDAIAEIERVLLDRYRAQVGREATAFTSRPGAGAWVMEMGPELRT